jgi:hypothetical protein
MTLIRRINTGLIRVDPFNPCHPRSIRNRTYETISCLFVSFTFAYFLAVTSSRCNPASLSTGSFITLRS